MILSPAQSRSFAATGDAIQGATYSDRFAIDFGASLAHHFASAEKVQTAADILIPMPRILLLYATMEGQTESIAERIAHRLRAKGHGVETLPADSTQPALDPAAYDGVVVGASVHFGHHPAYLHKLIRRHRDVLAARPSAFFSVSLSAGGPRPKPAAAQRYLDKFLRKTGWQPQLTASFAGAVKYSVYGPIKRRVMIVFVGLGGGETDTSRDYEYTDWDGVDRFADTYAQRLAQT